MTRFKAPKRCAMNRTLSALHALLLKMWSLWPKTWTKLHCAQQAPNTHLWLVSSHSIVVPLIFAKLYCYIVSAICFSYLCTSSNNASVVEPATFYSISASLFFNSLSLSSTAWDSLKASSYHDWVLACKNLSFLWRSSIYFWRFSPSVMLASLCKSGRVFMLLRFRRATFASPVIPPRSFGYLDPPAVRSKSSSCHPIISRSPSLCQRCLSMLPLSLSASSPTFLMVWLSITLL